MFKKKDRVLASLIAFMMIFSLVVTPKGAEAVGEPTLEISTPKKNYEVGEIFVAQVKVSDVTFNSSQITVYFEPTVLQVVDTSGNPATTAGKGLVINTAHMTGLGGDEDWTFSKRSIDNALGLVDVGIFTDPDVTDKYTVSTAEDYIGIRFKAIGGGDANIHFARYVGEGSSENSPAYTKANPTGYIFALAGDAPEMKLTLPDVTVGTAPETYTVTFDSKSGSEVDPITEIEENGTVTLPTAPTKEGFTFEGWFTDEALTTEFTSETKVTADITVYAKWKAEEVVDPETYTVT
ncbi:MAG TPA: InlB B-repeat-containing protein, partial [Tissierellaceae bacterium]|nr:InlB B-repeat-containing protein [Tissierellaceae bacterium]